MSSRSRRTRGTLALLATVVLATLAACSGGSEETPSATASSEETVTPVPALTATASPEASATPAVETRAISGWFSETRPIEGAEESALGPRPPSPFAGWNGNDVVLYDTVTMTETNLGPGPYAVFSPDSTRLAWASGPPDAHGILFVMDFATGEQREIGTGWPLRWLDGETLYVIRTNERSRVDAETGKRSPANEVDPNYNPLDDPIEAGSWRLERVAQGEYPIWRSAFLLTDLTGTELPLQFDAYRAVLSPDGVLFVAAVPQDADDLTDTGIGRATINIFEVDPATGAATFLSSAIASAPNWPFDASTTRVAWTDDYCSFEAADRPARTRLHDRASGEITQLDRGFWFTFLPDGRIGTGEFGPKAIVDLDTLAWDVVLPETFGDVRWSPDFRYAVTSFGFGHGGYCG